MSVVSLPWPTPGRGTKVPPPPPLQGCSDQSVQTQPPSSDYTLLKTHFTALATRIQACPTAVYTACLPLNHLTSNTGIAHQGM